VGCRFANSLWVKNVRSQFKDTVEGVFGACVFPLTDAEAINAWCSKHTNGMIPTAVDSLTPQTVMAAVSAVYFRGTWAHPFSKDDTREAMFTRNDSSVCRVQMMFQRGELLYLEEEGAFQMVELGYGERERFCCAILLPELPLATFLKADFCVSALTKWRASLRRREGVLHLPKFRIEAKVRNLKAALCKLGLSSLFDNPDGFQKIGDNIFMSDLFHKAVVEVNEEGAEAAAVGEAVFIKSSAGRQPLAPPPFEMRVDRPFLFVILDHEKDNILFLGAVENP